MSANRELAVYETSTAIQPAGANPGAALVAKTEEHENRLAHTIGSIRSQVGELMLSMRNEPEKREENQRQLETLMATLKQVEGQQNKLQTEVEQQRKELESIRAKHISAMRKEEPKPAPPLLMEELRALNQTKLDATDIAVRTAQAQEPKKYIASGGLTGFRVAPDLYKIDMDFKEAYKDPDEWRAPPKAAK